MANCIFAQDKTEYDAELTKCIELQHVKENFATGLNATYQQLGLKVDDMNAMCAEITELVYPKMVEALTDFYKQHYTLKELKELNKFLASPVGQKNLRLAPEAMQMGGAVVQRPETMSQIQEIARRHILQ